MKKPLSTWIRILIYVLQCPIVCIPFAYVLWRVFVGALTPAFWQPAIGLTALQIIAVPFFVWGQNKAWTAERSPKFFMIVAAAYAVTFNFFLIYYGQKLSLISRQAALGVSIFALFAIPLGFVGSYYWVIKPRFDARR